MSRTESTGATARSNEYSFLGDRQSSSHKRHRAPQRPMDKGRIEFERQATARTQRVQVQPRGVAAGQKLLSQAAFCVFIALAMVLMFVQITRIAEISGNMKRISSISTVIREAQNEKGNLSVRLSMQQNITRVRDEAINRLGMVEPDPHQIKVVSPNVNSVDSQMRTASAGVQTME